MSNITAEDLLCFPNPQQYDIALLVVATVGLVVGVFYTFLGYRFYQIVLFLTGFIFGSVAIYLICSSEEFLPILGNVGIALVAGILVGIITMLVIYVGLFMTGLLTGIVLSIVSLLCIAAAGALHTIWITVGVVLGSALLCALIALKWQRGLFIVNTAVVGAALIASSVDYLLTHHALTNHIVAVISPKTVPFMPPCLASWFILASWPLLTVLGVFVQSRLTSGSTDHKRREDWPSETLKRAYRSRRPLSPTKRTDPSRARFDPIRSTPSSGDSSTIASPVLSPATIPQAETPALPQHPPPTRRGHKQHTPSPPRLAVAAKPYRQLYAQRRAKGDIVCHSYVESLQRLAERTNSGDLSHSDANTLDTLSSEATKLTVISSPAGFSGDSGSSLDGNRGRPNII